MRHYQYLDSPLGQLKLWSDGERLLAIEFEGRHSQEQDSENRSDAVLDACAQQLVEYFAGERQAFSLPLGAGGTAFQQAVWDALCDIPFGEVRSYGAIADGIGKPTAVRAVGAANGRNPIPIVVPCHRVIGSDGSLTGFAGGLDCKRQLLALEGVNFEQQGVLFPEA